jgi:fructokinase
MIARADLVKLSDEDLHWLAGAGDLGDLARASWQGAEGWCSSPKAPAGARAVTADAEDRFVPATPGHGGRYRRRGRHVQRRRPGRACTRGALTKAGVANCPRRNWTRRCRWARAAAVTVSRAGANPPWSHEL